MRPNVRDHHNTPMSEGDDDMTLMKRLLTGMALAGLITAPLYAKAVASAKRPGNYTFTGANHTLPLTAGGATSVSFSGKGKFLVSYVAECETEGSWLSIEIFVDGVSVSPTTGTSDAFCSDHNNDGLLNGWTTAHYRVETPSLPLGSHFVQVRGTVVGGATEQGWLGDTVLLVEK
jgi:hypothetical protein